ncbi:MAG: adenylyltransferase/cytidyltransferase family protein [bacterium]|nr:adenylyltransferase/cytidyltransferase family protein [bacterium]
MKIHSGALVGETELLEEVRERRRRGESIVIANGCFDILHVGHIRYLKEAAKLGDFLIVAINSDKSVYALKGRGRPVFGEKARSVLISALPGVSAVVIFSDTTLDRLIAHIKPDIQAKGTDYTEESVPERETVLACGGKVMICGDPKDHSTRYVIDDILSGKQEEK